MSSQSAPTGSSSGSQVLATATLDAIHRPLQDLTTQLEELERGQQGWISTLTQEQQSLVNVDKDFADVLALFSQVPPYLQKLHQMKKDMKDMQERVKKMHSTALKIKERRIHDEEQRAEKDRQILAQPAPSPASNPVSNPSASSNS